MVTPLHTIEKRMWEALVAFLMLCGGSAVMVLLYMWFAWYASLYAMRLRAENGGTDNGGATKNGLSVSDIQTLPTFICTSKNERLGVETDGYGRKTELKSSDGFFLCEDLECTVCLEQFKDGERCLFMPSCRHCFHLECAQAWLSKQPLCPVCRTRCDPQQQGSFGSNQHVPDALTIDVLAQR